MDIGSIRRNNMLKLIANFRTQSDFAEAVDKPASYISQIKKGFKSNGDTISMGSEFARDVEAAMGLDHGWMDVYHAHEGEIEQDLIMNGIIDPKSSWDKYQETKRQLDISKRSSTDHITIGGQTKYPLVDIKYLNIKASCGNGYANEDYPVAHTQLFTVEFLRDNNLPIDGEGLVLMHACSDSMGYTIPHGTLMLVNTNESEFDNFANNKIYVFNADGEMMCKRAIKNLNGAVILKSDNMDKETYPDQVITRDTFGQFNLFGRVRYTFIQL